MSNWKLEDIIDQGGETTYRHYLAKYPSLRGKVGFSLQIWRAYRQVKQLYAQTLRDKECYYGPFKGEFGHFLLHNLPFISYLHAQGVKVHYCGMALHKPFLIDESGNSLVHTYHELRDFFKEVKPQSNFCDPPEDVQQEIATFKKTARQSGKVLWEIDQEFFYWHAFRNWVLVKPHQKAYRINRYYQPEKEKAAVIFPRKKGGTFSPNNGGPWDYTELARTLSPYFDKVYVTGHPSLSAELESFDNVEVCLSEDNTTVIEKCSAARLIVTQHSGAVHMGSYTDTPVLLIFNGKPPIKGLADTLRFRRHLNPKHALSFAFSLKEIEAFVKAGKF
ncbi:MAG: hypothetical protein ACFB10_17930 [Salibacteraceae bacterium]